MSSNDDSPVSQPQPVEPGLPSSSNENPKIDTVDTLLRTIFRMDWGDWVLTAVLISCLINHYFFTVLNIAQPIIDFTRLITALISVIFIACKVVSGYKSKELITIFFKNHPLQLFILIIACGATAAFFLPLILNISKFIGETDKLTTALLASTGGVIAVFTLIKTHQKNQNDEQTLGLDREKYNQQIKDREEDIKRQEAERLEQKEQFEKNLKAQSEKNKQDHTRQVHAERRSRYTTAVEQLANENAAVRLGGIYTLVGLVDEWLADDSLKAEEGQTIINNLCAYIRSPFPTAEKIEEYEAHKELEELEEKEPENLSTEESLRLKALQTRFNESAEYKNPEDIDTDYVKFHEEQDVRRAIFEEMSKRSSTVSVDESMNETIKSGAWSGFKFDFSRAQIFYPLKGITFEHPIFMESTFYKGSDFSQAYFVGDTDFKYAYFNNTLHFDKTYFIGDANFTEAKSKEELYFTRTRFLGETYFTYAFFGGDAIFNWVRFKKTAHFNQSGFFSHTSFHATNFKGELGFTDAYFEKTANFRLARFEGPVNFSAFFKNESPSFVDSDGKIKSVAYFSYNVDKKKYNFFAITDSPHKIKLGKAELKGKKFRIPVGTRLFDPDSWNETDRKYTESDPAEPVDESDEAEEDKTE